MISLLFCGDFAPVRRFESLVIEKKASIFGDLLKEVKDSDISFINLESPACNIHSPILKSGPVMKVKPECLESLYDAGFDVVGMANNHIRDHGDKGVLQTLDSCKKFNLNYVGVGSNIKEAQEPIIIERRGVKVAIIAVSEHEFGLANKFNPGAAHLDPIDNTYQIEMAKSRADLVIVTIHGGNEYFPYPRPGLRKICHFFIDQGVDGIICHHPHIPGSYELYNDKPIFYSLGNIIFDKLNPHPGWFEGYAVDLKFNPENKKLISFKIIPYHQSVEHGGLKLLKGNKKDLFIKKINHYNSTLDSWDKYISEWDNFCLNRKKEMLFSNYLPINPIFSLISIIPINILFLSKKSISTKLNLIRCESHLEVMQTILTKIYNGYEE